MTHEPECDAATLSVKGHEFNLPCICEVARAAYQRGHQIGYRTGCEEQSGRDAYDRYDIEHRAYQRGREDAANALVDLPAAAWGDNLSPLNFEAIFAAARGDGNHE